MSFDPMNMDEQTRAFVEQHSRHQQQQQSQPPSRNGKAEAQRALGVAAQPTQHPPAQRVMLAQNGHGQYYVDAQGRPVQVNGWQAQQRMMPNGQFTPGQLQQHQQMLQQQFAQKQFVQQQQLAQQRAAQQPSVRPQQAPTQSPVMLQVPPPPLKRTVSRAQSRSASPIPPHLRPPSATVSHPMQATTSAMPTSHSNPTLLPVRASTLPASSSAQANFSSSTYAPAVASSAHPSRFAPLTSKPQASSESSSRYDKPYRREAKLSAVARARRREETTSRLRRHIEQAQAQLEAAMKEEEDAKVDGEMKKDEIVEKRQGKFNELILE